MGTHKQGIPENERTERRARQIPRPLKGRDQSEGLLGLAASGMSAVPEPAGRKYLSIVSSSPNDRPSKAASMRRPCLGESSATTRKVRCRPERTREEPGFRTNDSFASDILDPPESTMTIQRGRSGKVTTMKSSPSATDWKGDLSETGGSFDPHRVMIRNPHPATRRRYATCEILIPAPGTGTVSGCRAGTSGGSVGARPVTVRFSLAMVNHAQSQGLSLMTMQSPASLPRHRRRPDPRP